ncbi:MAG: FCD domain-containing protein [Betaproteobacteria bacterium]|nr:FCD domain-containing protein [Betaproteobacteria bacterium]
MSTNPHLSGQDETLTGQAHRRLEEMIVTVELEPGSVVSEAMLSSRLGIGTTPVREALQRLAREYLVQIFPRRGVVVTAIDVRQQLQVLEVRRELERLIVRAATKRAGAAERAAIADLADRMEASAGQQDPRAFLRLDAELKALVSRAAANEVAADAILPLHAVSRRFWFYHHADSPAGAITNTLHVGLARAIVSGDDVAAAAACDRLIDDLTRFAKATLPTELSRSGG